MMRSVRPFLFVSAALFALAAVPGCKKEEEKPKVEEKAEKKDDEKPKAKARPKSNELSPEVPLTRLGEVPTSEDLEEEAAKTVSVDNLEAELDRLEAEIVGLH